MNRKHNPLLSLAALLLAAIILVLTCTGCNSEAMAAENDTTPGKITEETEPAAPAAVPDVKIGRFNVQYAGSGWPHVNGLYVVTDTETGVQYLYVDNANGGGLTVLQPGEE